MGDILSIFSTKENAGLTKNLAYAATAQGMGFVSSIVMSLVIPKVLGLENYAYWQMFTLYSSYTGFAALGVNDGIYLRLGGMRYGELDKSGLKAQLSVIGISQVTVGALCLATLLASGISGDRLLVFLVVIVYGLLANNFVCLGYVFQSVNLTQVSSLASFFNKVLFLPLLASFIVLDIDSYISVVVAFILCQLVAFAYLLVCARDVIRIRCGSLSKAARTCAADVRAGAKVMVAYYADSLVVGFTRMLTDWHLGLAVFGKLSFSFSLINFALNFVGQFAMVAFPVLKRLGEEGKREKYLEIRSVLHCFLPAVYLGYAPVLLILGWWLPEYRESLAYLGLVLPVCVYSCKANILFSTYLKMSRDEGLLCAVNVATMVANAALSATAILGTGSVGAASVGIVASLAARDFAFERIMAGRYGEPYVRDCVLEAVISAVFMAASWFLAAWSVLPVAAALAAFWWVERGQAAPLARGLAVRLRRERGSEQQYG